MTETYSIRFAWERFNGKKAIVVVVLVLVCCLTAIFFTARPAEAEKQERIAYKYYTTITVKQGDTLWGIAEEQLRREETKNAYRSTRVYVREITELNRLSNADYLLAGEQLVVPYYSSAYMQ